MYVHTYIHIYIYRLSITVVKDVCIHTHVRIRANLYTHTQSTHIAH